MRVRIFCIVLFFLAVCGEAAGAPLFRFSGELASSGVREYRLAMASSRADLRMLYRGREGVPEYNRFSLSFPLVDTGSIDTGSITRRGLLREMENPAGYTPESGVYSGSSGYYRDNSLSRSSPLGAVGTLKLEQWKIQVPLLFHPAAHPPGLPRRETGFFVEGECTSRCTIAATCRLVRIPDPGEADSWFLATPEVAGQDMLAAAASLGVDLPGGRVAAAAGYSRPSRLPSGWFARGLAEYTLGLLKLHTLAAGCSGDYLEPGGAFPAQTVNLGVSAYLFHDSPATFFLRLRRVLDRTALLPDVARGVKETVCGGVDVRAEYIRMRVSMERRITWESDGTGHIEETLDVESGYYGDNLRLSAGLGYYALDKDGGELDGRIEAGGAIGDFRGSAVLRLEDEKTPGGTVKATLSGEELKASLSLDSDGSVRFSLGLSPREVID